MFLFLQLRLDFSSFIITGPSTSTVSVAKTIGGQVSKENSCHYALCELAVLGEDICYRGVACRLYTVRAPL